MISYKTIFFSLSIFFSSLNVALAESDSTFVAATVTSDYVSRGITQNNNLVSVQSVIEDNSLNENLLLGLWSSSAYGYGPETEVDVYFKYSLPINTNLKFAYSLLYYYYTKTHDFNTLDSQFYIESNWVNFIFSYRQNFFGTNTNNLYYELYKRWPLKKDWSAQLTAGYATFAQNEKAGMTNYYNYRVSLYKTVGNVELSFFFTQTNREIINSDLDKLPARDQVFGSAITYTF